MVVLPRERTGPSQVSWLLTDWATLLESAKDLSLVDILFRPPRVDTLTSHAAARKQLNSQEIDTGDALLGPRALLSF